MRQTTMHPQPSPTEQAAHAPGSAGRPAPLQADAAIAALQFMLNLEAEARALTSIDELGFFAVSGARKLSNARQVFLLQANGAHAFHALSISSVAAVDRNSPLVIWVERMAGRIAKDSASTKVLHFSLPAYCDAKDPETSSHPFREFLWAPLKNKTGKVTGALLLASERPWVAEEFAPIERFADVCSHSLEFLTKRSGRAFSREVSKRSLTIAALIAAGLAIIPVRLTALAPAEVIARAPTIVAAPLEGVISDIPVEPSARVKAGDVLFQFNDTQARSAADIAEREVRVAEAKLRQAKQGAFVDQSYNREVAIAAAELAVKESERDYARDVLGKLTVRAEREGLVLFGDKRDLIGRPVSVGQRVMEIADPGDIALRVLLSVDDAAVMEQNGRVRMFLDSDPLHPISGVITRTSHLARVNEGNQLTFRIDAIPEVQGEAPRLGLRGTAQVVGSYVPLAYFLFRRPLSSLRQRLGI